MSTNSLLTPCKQGAVLSRYSIGLGNENELLTHTLQQRAVRCSLRCTIMLLLDYLSTAHTASVG